MKISLFFLFFMLFSLFCPLQVTYAVNSRITNQKLYVDDKRVVLKIAEVLADYARDDLRSYIPILKQKGYNAIIVNASWDNFDPVGDGQIHIDPDLTNLNNFIHAAEEQGIYIILHFATYNVGGGATPDNFFSTFPDTQAKNSEGKRAIDDIYVSVPKKIQSIFNRKFLDNSRNFIKNILRKIDTSKILFYKTTVEPMYIGNQFLDYSADAIEAYRPYAQELLQNGDFENVNTIWTYWKAGRINHLTYNNGGYQSPGYLAVNSPCPTCGDPGSPHPVFYQEVPVTTNPGDIFLWSIYVRSPTQSPITGTLTLWNKTQQGTDEQIINKSFTVSGSSWQKIVETGKVSKAGNKLSADIYIYTNSNINYYFDNASLLKAPAENDSNWNLFRARSLANWINGDVAAIREVAGQNSLVSVDYLEVGYPQVNGPEVMRNIMGNSREFLNSLTSPNIIRVNWHWLYCISGGSTAWTGVPCDLGYDNITDLARQRNWAVTEHMTINGDFNASCLNGTSNTSDMLQHTINKGNTLGWTIVNTRPNSHDPFAVYNSDWSPKCAIAGIDNAEGTNYWLARLSGGEYMLPSPTPTPSYLPSDINHDEKIDIFDYNLLIQNFGRTRAQGFLPSTIDPDIVRNDVVDIFDYNILIENFGSPR